MSDFNIVSNEEFALVEKMRKEKQHEEYKYLHLLQKILDEGTVKGDRTGTGTKSIYGTQLKFDLRNSLPVLTTKKVFWKGVVEELLWFIRGQTDSKLLEAKGVKIWTGNTSREFLDKKGLKWREGEIGPGYGFQWRHWGKYYDESVSDVTEGVIQSRIVAGGVDQFAKVIETLKKNPNDRRMIVSAWNPDQIDMMALPPCHLLYQFDVTDGYLNCQWYQRSVDSFLGLPFNITSYAVLTYIVAKTVGLKPGTLTFAGGDTHLYLNHLEQVKEQLGRTPFTFPKLTITKELNTVEDIEKLELADLVLEGYQSHAAIKAEMAV
jgi:thymidylate synthase